MTQNLNAYIEENCDQPVDQALIEDLQALLKDSFEKYFKTGEQISIHAKTGLHCAFLQATFGADAAAHIFEFAATDVEGEPLDGALGLLIDYLGEVIAEFLENDREAFLPLDYSLSEVDRNKIYVRHEFRNFAAEKLANEFLQ